MQGKRLTWVGPVLGEPGHRPDAGSVCGEALWRNMTSMQPSNEAMYGGQRGGPHPQTTMGQTLKKYFEVSSDEASFAH